MWTFSWMFDQGVEMFRSERKFETAELAADAMAKWAVVCAENDELIIVKLVRI